MSSYFFATNGVRACAHEHHTFGEALHCADRTWPPQDVYMSYLDFLGREITVRLDVDGVWWRGDETPEELIGSLT